MKRDIFESERDGGRIDSGEILLDRVQLLGRILRALRELSGDGIVVDLSAETCPEADENVLERLVFRGRTPGTTVAAAALSAVTGWHPVPGDGPGTVDLLDAMRRRRLRIRAERDSLAIEIHDPDAPAAGLPMPSLVRRKSPKVKKAGRCSSSNDVFEWLDGLHARCDEVVT
ncbi:MAG TPA: hypothetical protein ENK53_05335, partial [Thiotrichales bacterium]|nr:hypothetical protein [Thiotrichales bacterium]